MAQQSTTPTPKKLLLGTFLLWVLAYLGFVLAVDNGSIAVWAGVIICLIWGVVRLIHALVYLYVKK